MDNPGVLNSWKEISNYIGRGVRTVQRWERDFGLPVRRPAGHMKSAVVALRGDIDAWLLSRRMREVEAPKPKVTATAGLDLSRLAQLTANIELLHKNLEVLKVERARFIAMRDSRLMEATPDNSASSAVTGTAA